MISAEQLEAERTERAKEVDLSYLFRVATPPDWEGEGALCREVGPGPWDSDKMADVRQAQRICARCPVQQACLAYAVDPGNNITWGTWGGVSRLQREHGVTEFVVEPWMVAVPHSEVPGVHWIERSNVWRVQIVHEGVLHYGGHFKDVGEAEWTAGQLRATLEAQDNEEGAGI